MTTLHYNNFCIGWLQLNFLEIILLITADNTIDLSKNDKSKMQIDQIKCLTLGVVMFL